MKKNLALYYSLSLMVLAAVGALSVEQASANDQPVRREIGRRQARQARRIREGVKTGKISPPEAAQLRSQQKAIREEKRADLKANGNGQLTADQARQLNQELNQASQDIKKAKGN